MRGRMVAARVGIGVRGMVALGGSVVVGVVGAVIVDLVIAVNGEPKRLLCFVGQQVLIRSICDTALSILWPLVRVALVIDVDGASLDGKGMVPSRRPERRVLVPASNRQSHRTYSVLSATSWMKKGFRARPEKENGRCVAQENQTF